MKTVTLTPARGGSKGIPRKNLADLGGAPLISHAIRASLESRAEETWVSTEDAEIARVSLRHGAQVMRRPDHLAEDDVSTEDVLIHFARNVPFDAVVLLQCTCPFTTPEDINSAIVMLEEYDSVLSVSELHQFIWTEGVPNYSLANRPRRQEAANTYIETGGLFATRRAALDDSGCRVSGSIGFLEVPRWRAVDIDTEEDLQLARMLLGFTSGEGMGSPRP